MKRIILILSYILISHTGWSQSPKCDCTDVYDDLIKKLEENYIQLAHLKNSNQDLVYEERKREYKKKVTKTNDSNCTRILQQFLEYFEDGHLFVFEVPKYSEKETAKISRKLKQKAINTKSILRTLEYEKNTVEKNGLDGIIGRWTDGKSEFAIIKDEGYYKAFVINSTLETVKPGELKAKFTSNSNGFEGTYYTYEYSPRFVEGNIYKESTLMVFTGANYWGKIGENLFREYNMLHNEDPRLPVIQKLDNENTLFSIPSFMVDFERFNQIILDNFELLKNTTNLIFDIRGNVGGNAIYFSFLDAYATQPIESSQGLILASEETKIYFEQLSKNGGAIYGPVIERIETNKGKIVDGPRYPIREFQPFESEIENVAILADRGSMSAAESFIIHSKKASTKVKTFGEPTRGVIDYTSVNSIKLNSGDQNIYFGYPTSTLHKNIFIEGYNETGITPDIPIKDNVVDKIQFIIDYYKNK